MVTQERVDELQKRLDEGILAIGRVTRKLEEEGYWEMDGIKPAVDRITYIITGEGKRVTKPGCLSGRNSRTTTGGVRTQGVICSYDKVIGIEQEDGSWRLEINAPDRTTYRHTVALSTALDNLSISWRLGRLA